MYIDLSIFSALVPYLPLILPFVVAFVAGILRQDGLPVKVNQGITIVLVLIAACVSAFYNHALTANTSLDLAVILAYSTAIIRLPALQDLQQYLQSNWLNVILSNAQKLTATPQPAPPIAPGQPPYRVTYNPPAQEQSMQPLPFNYSDTRHFGDTGIVPVPSQVQP